MYRTYTLRIIQRENKFGKKAGELKKHRNGSKEKELIAFETLSVTYGRRDTKRFKLFMSCLFFFSFINYVLHFIVYMIQFFTVILSSSL